MFLSLRKMSLPMDQLLQTVKTIVRHSVQLTSPTMKKSRWTPIFLCRLACADNKERDCFLMIGRE